MIIQKDGWLLVLEKTGQAIRAGDKVGDYHVMGGRPPLHPASTGRIWVGENSVEYFPHVAGLKWIKQTKTWHVHIKIEATIDVEAGTREEAEWKAAGEFDPTAYDREIVESWTEEGEE